MSRSGETKLVRLRSKMCCGYSLLIRSQMSVVIVFSVAYMSFRSYATSPIRSECDWQQCLGKTSLTSKAPVGQVAPKTCGCARIIARRPVQIGSRQTIAYLKQKEGTRGMHFISSQALPMKMINWPCFVHAASGGLGYLRKSLG